MFVSGSDVYLGQLRVLLASALAPGGSRPGSHTGPNQPHPGEGRGQGEDRAPRGCCRAVSTPTPSHGPVERLGGCSWVLTIQEKSCFLLRSEWHGMDCPGAPRGVFTWGDLHSSSDSWPGVWVTMDSRTSSLWVSAKGAMIVGSAAWLLSVSSDSMHEVLSCAVARRKRSCVDSCHLSASLGLCCMGSEDVFSPPRSYIVLGPFLDIRPLFLNCSSLGFPFGASL